MREDPTAKAARTIARALGEAAPRDRPALLEALLAHVAAGLIITYGDNHRAAESIYRCADMVVDRSNR